ncbi:MAG: DNA-directed RNA polymerase subunit omega [Vicinamibacteraceae bacterium]|nr:DNA-directed RNA polymerase subunit omega [Vicinamibacteraceae bacterium]
MESELQEAQEHESEVPVVPTAEPIESRFLFVDVSAQRAKQLRRGARPRVPVPADGPLKLERVAMREVEDRLVEWDLPPLVPPGERDARE